MVLSEVAATMPSVTGQASPPPGADPAGEAADSVPSSPTGAIAAVRVSGEGWGRSNGDAPVEGGGGGGGGGSRGGSVGGSRDGTPKSSTSSAVKEFEMEKVFRIKDLDTGNEFLVDEAAADSMMGGKTLSDRGDGRGGGDASAAVVRDLQTGRSLTIAEFEASMGLSPLMREMHLREGMQETSQGEGGGAGGKPKPPKTAVDGAEKTKKKKKFGRNPKRWLKKRMGLVHGHGEDPASPSKQKGGPGYVENADDPAMAAIRAAAAASGQPAPADSTAPHPGFGREPPGSAIKVNVNRKIYKEYTELRLVQRIEAHQDAIWTMRFSHDGEYLATAGQDKVVRVWELDRDDVAEGASAGAGAGDGAGLGLGEREKGKISGEGIFKSKPLREYTGHTGDVLDLCWSHTNWLLSSSMDKTVRLWYMTMDECLRIFSHQDFVTAIDFHPINDKYFLSGSLDGKLRFWNIPDHRVADWVDIGEMVTAATFTSDGSCAVAGSYKGKCHFYSMDGVRFDYLTQLDVRNRSSTKPGGKKVTGLQFMPGDDTKLLVTSNDSRIRVYDGANGYSLACKYKGHRNNNSQIRASFSNAADFIVCGSEDENVYVWSTVNSFVPSINPMYTGYRRDKHSSYEQFAAQADISTVALFAPPEVSAARGGAAAAACDAARAKITGKPTRAAAALFKGRKGSIQSPSMRDELDDLASATTGSGGSGGGGDGASEDDGEGGEGKKSKQLDARAEARAEGERAFASGTAIGKVIATSGYSGEIRIFENVGSPCWL
jgi:WD40 repeat protein